MISTFIYSILPEDAKCQKTYTKKNSPYRTINNSKSITQILGPGTCDEFTGAKAPEDSCMHVSTGYWALNCMLKKGLYKLMNLVVLTIILHISANIYIYIYS